MKKTTHVRIFAETIMSTESNKKEEDIMGKSSYQGISPLRLFYSYADQDEKLRQELEKHLHVLQRQGIISSWHHHKILPGANQDKVNIQQFSRAQIILLLISPDFLASDLLHSLMQLALERHEASLASVIPLLLRPVGDQVPFAHLKALPHNGKPVTLWKDRDLAFVDIAKGIRSVVQQRSLSHGQASNSLVEPSLWAPPYPFFLLVSAHQDVPVAQRLRDDLQLHGMMGWVDTEADSNEDLRETIRNASTIILIVSSATRNARSLKQAFSIAAIYSRPIYLFWIEGNHFTEVVQASWGHLPCIDARQERYPLAVQDLVSLLKREARPFSAQDISERLHQHPSAVPRNPYKGLERFGVEDARDFFGRDRLVEELLRKLGDLLMTHEQGKAPPHLLTVLGPSGLGKSSVVLAGLIPKLKQGALPQSQEWIYLEPMSPGLHPIETLMFLLVPLLPEYSLKRIREDLQDDSARGLHLLLTQGIKPSGRRVFLVIDQFEALFTQVASEEERRQFLDLLLTAAKEPDGSLILVLTLRTDFYHHLFQYPELAHIVEAHRVTIYPLEIRDMRASIEKPAQLPDVQLVFDEDLVGDLLFDVQGQTGALPLLQFTLDQLFHHRQGRYLTSSAYQALGGVKGALARHAEAIYQSLPDQAHRNLARALFLRLIHLGTVEQDVTLRRIPLSDLIVLDQEETTRLVEVTKVFTQARLLTINSFGEIATIEVSHEALLLIWTRLSEWLHEAPDDIRFQQALTIDVREWDRYGQPADRLYRGSQLREAIKWRETNLPSLSEDRFLQASIEEFQRIQQEERRDQQRSRRRLLLISLAGLTGMAGTGLLVNALRDNRTSSPPVFPKSFPYAYNGHNAPVYSVAWSPDGGRIVSGSTDGKVQVWDVRSGSLLFTYTGHNDIVIGLAWSPDGKRIASSAYDKTVQIWDASTGSHVLTYSEHLLPVYSITWEPSGKRICSGSFDKTLHIWNGDNGTRLLIYEGHSDKVLGMDWSPDGKYIASGSFDRTVQVWDANSGSHLLTYRDHLSPVSSVGWSLDGKRIASCSTATNPTLNMHVWDAAAGNRLLTYTGHSRAVEKVAWDPSGSYLASCSRDETVQVWNAKTGSVLLFYTGHSNTVWSVTWEPSGKHIASCSDDKTVQVWEVQAASRLLLTYNKHMDLVWNLAWEPSGKRIASSSLDGTVQVWEATSGNRLLVYSNHQGIVNNLAWSADGRFIVSGSGDKTVQVWEATTGKPVFTYKGHTDVVVCVAWSPDGTHVASGSLDGTVQIWKFSEINSRLIYRGHGHNVYSLAWSPNSSSVASSSLDKTVQVWDATTGKRLFIYSGHKDAVNSVAWAPSGTQIASASTDKTVQIWSLNTS